MSAAAVLGRRPVRCAAAGIPADIEFATKPQLAIDSRYRMLILLATFASLAVG